MTDRLAGTWNLTREIEGTASLAGTASFHRLGDGLLDFHERGCLRLRSGQMLEAERRYLFRKEEDGFSVLFPEDPPRLFHRVRLEETTEGLMGEAEHLCGDDCYRSRYLFRADGSFSTHHHVRGPRKDQVIASLYTIEPDLNPAR